MVLDLQVVDLQPQGQDRNVAGAVVSATSRGSLDYPVILVTASDDHTSKIFRWPLHGEGQAAVASGDVATAQTNG